MNITINPELQACLDPWTPGEYETRKRNMLAEGWRDAPVV